MGHAKKERVLLFGTDQRITSGPAAKRLHSKAEYMNRTRTLRSNVRFLLHRGRRPYMAHRFTYRDAAIFPELGA